MSEPSKKCQSGTRCNPNNQPCARILRPVNKKQNCCCKNNTTTNDTSNTQQVENTVAKILSEFDGFSVNIRDESETHTVPKVDGGTTLRNRDNTNIDIGEYKALAAWDINATEPYYNGKICKVDEDGVFRVPKDGMYHLYAIINYMVIAEEKPDIKFDNKPYFSIFRSNKDQVLTKATLPNEQNFSADTSSFGLLTYSQISMGGDFELKQGDEITVQIHNWDSDTELNIRIDFSTFFGRRIYFRSFDPNP